MSLGLGPPSVAIHVKSIKFGAFPLYSFIHLFNFNVAPFLAHMHNGYPPGNLMDLLALFLILISC